MKKLLLSLLLAVLPLSSFAASGTAIPGGNQSTPFVINKPGAYYLAANRVMTTLGQPAIQIASSDVTLDLNGYTLSFPTAEGPYSPGIKADGANIEIRNGSISTVPGRAIHVNGITDNVGMRIIDLRVADSRGILAGSRASLVERCQVIDTRGTGIEASPYSIVKDCVVRNVMASEGSDTGVGISLSSGSILTGCMIHETAQTGISCGSYSMVKNNLVSRANLANSASAAGIVAVWLPCTISENSVFACHAAGIRVTADAPGAVLEKNVISDTEKGGPQIGFAIVSSSASTIVRGNTGHSNAAGFISGSFIDGGNNLVF